MSRKTAYKWLLRYRREGVLGLVERSPCLAHSPVRTSSPIEAAVVTFRQLHPAKGGRNLHRRLWDIRHRRVSAPSTITSILHRYGLIEAEEPTKNAPRQRFEHVAPNRLWQMAFKGHFALEQGHCYRLTFRRYGLADRITMDKGVRGYDGAHPLTPLAVWLVRGVGVSHSRPYHSQTQGKDEGFHRTLEAALRRWGQFQNLLHCQRGFNRWRAVHNFERPHEALDMAVPASCYQPSPRPFPEHLFLIEHGPMDIVRKVQADQRGTRFTISNTHVRIRAIC